MTMIFRAAMAGTAMLMLAGCGAKTVVASDPADEMAQVEPKIPDTGCLSEAGRTIAIGALTKQITKQVGIDAPTDADHRIPSAVVRNSVESLDLGIEDVRTTAQDERTTKRSCTGMLSVKLPASVRAKAGEALSSTDSTTIDDLATRYDFEIEDGAYRIALDYSVQPTDDGDKIYAEVVETQNIVGFLTKIVIGDVYSGRIRLAKQEIEKREVETRSLEERANVMQDRTSLAESTDRRRLSIARINAAWDSMPQFAQDELLVQQRAWNKRRTAMCRAQAAGATSDTTRMLTLHYDCESAANNARAAKFEDVARKASSPEGL